MVILGHKAIKYPNFKKIADINDIKNSIASDILLLDINNDKNYIISKHCSDNNLEYAILIDNITNTLIYAKLNAKYLLYNSLNTAKMAQKIADKYFFDSKIVSIIDDEKELDLIAKLGIDGVIFKKILDS